MNPKMALNATEQIEKEMRKAKSMTVDVGLIEAKVTGSIYDNGETVLEVGFQHEFGVGKLPQRSFIRAPFIIKQKEIKAFINKQLDNLFGGYATAETVLGKIGVYATNISQGAFTTKGYGQWQDISQYTKDKKGSSQILIDTGTLVNSITWQINK